MRARNHNGPRREDPPRKMPVHAPPGPMPTLADLANQHVTELRVWCGAWPQRCFHRGVVRLDLFRPAETIEQASRRLVCTKCGLSGGYAQPHWPS